MPALYQHDPFLAIQGFLWHGAFWSDAFWEVASTACEGWAMALIAFLFVYARTRELRGLLQRTLPFLVVLLAVGILAQVLKAIANTPRPLAVLGPAQVHVLLAPLLGQAFPSGHSASAAAVAAYGLRRFGRSAWPLLLLAFLGGLSRVMVGAHWTFDVLGGWALGGLLAELLWRAEHLLARPPSAPPQSG